MRYCQPRAGRQDERVRAPLSRPARQPSWIQKIRQDWRRAPVFL